MARRSIPLTIMLSEEESQAIQKAAANSKMSTLTEWGRFILRYAAGLGSGSLKEQMKRAQRANPWVFASKDE